jgi:hypothetical protein
MGSQWKVEVRPVRAESEAVSLTGDSPSPEVEHIAGNTDDSMWSRRIGADVDRAATNTSDAVEWLTRVLQCAVHGQGPRDAES